MYSADILNYFVTIILITLTERGGALTAPSKGSLKGKVVARGPRTVKEQKTMLNQTFSVSALFKCESIEEYRGQYEHDPIWRQTYLGCFVLQMLRDMYSFNISYVNINTSNADNILYPHFNNSVDIYVRPMSIKDQYLDYAYPVHAIFQWRFGFLLRHKQEKILQTFYSLPFTSRVWSCIIFILFLSSLVFYLLSYWEKRLIGGECSYWHELLLAFSAYCQHILPLNASLYSRRIAYLIFILSSYVVHCFYTSNLLSHLVNDKDRTMDLEGLARNDYEFAIIKDMTLITDLKRIQQVPLDKNLSLVENKLRNVKIMNVSSALKALRDTKTAVLSDYTSLYTIIKRSFDKAAVCELIEVDLYSMVKKYFFTSKRFLYKEEFKIGIQRAKETGLIRRVLTYKRPPPFSCKEHERAYLDFTVVPIAILLGSFVITIIILMAEVVCYNRNHVWPYVE